MRIIKKKSAVARLSIMLVCAILVMMFVTGCAVGPMQEKQESADKNTTETSASKETEENKDTENREDEKENADHDTADENTSKQDKSESEAISIEEAQKIVQEKFEDFSPYKIELKKDDIEGDEYKLKGYSGDEKIVVKLDAQTGDELETKKEDIGDDSRKETFGIGNLKELDACLQAAENKLPDDYKLHKWKLKMDDGRLVYKFEFENNNDQEAEIKVDAQTEQVVDVDLDD